MSQLTRLLNLIESWVQQSDSDELELVKMHPGLTLEQIEEKLTRLPYKLSEETIELYQWHNGGHNSFLPLPDGAFELQRFLDLDEAISCALCWNKETFPNMNAFPLFSVEGAIYWTVGSEVQQDVSPIYSNDHSQFPVDPDGVSLSAFLEKTIQRLRFKWKIDEEITQANNSLGAE